MIWGRKGFVALLAALVGLWPAWSFAAPINVASVCHAEAQRAESYASIANQPTRWNCSGTGWDLEADTTFLRFELAGAQGAPPRSLVTHAVRFDRITATVMDDDGATRSLDFGLKQARHLDAGPQMTVPLPAVTARSREVIVRIDAPWGKALLSDAHLDSSPEGTGWPAWRIAALGVVCGMLLVPLLLNLAFYVVLPERFIVWHMVMVVTMLVQTLLGSGFIHLMMTIHDPAEAVISNLCFAGMAAAAMLFATNFLEPECVDDRLRRAMSWAAVAAGVVGLITTLQAPALRAWSTTLVHLNMVVPLLLVSLALADAWRKGSRLVVFPLVGWTPAMAVGLWRVIGYVLPGNTPPDIAVIYSFALAVEVVITAVGIISRFTSLRQERDSAMVRASELEGMAGRDPLTGLNNRLSIERRFDELFVEGFRTMAVIDLDRFKDVNDTHGHAVGDAVLKATARALASERDTHAIRMGGEEFLLLLRGPFAIERAERCRRAISARVAAEVAGLDRMITASMGLVEASHNDPTPVDFTRLYAHCDRLLYEAKHAGRNRTVRERIEDDHGSPMPVAVSI